jgi:uncharacterized SAM-binding protein YcdF (DUF218 family)
MKGHDAHDAADIAHIRGRGGRRTMSRALRIAGFITGCFTLAVLAFVGGFVAFSLHVASMETPGDPARADAIIVLTGGQARIDAAVELLNAGKGDRLLISGVNPMARVADIRSATGGAQALFDCCVDIDHAALDTIGNAEESAKWINSHAFRSVIVVTNNYHMPRSLMEMRRYLRDAVLHPYPVVNSRLDQGEWMTKPDAFRVMFTEYMKYLASFGRGLLPAVPAMQASTLVETG